MLECSVGDFRPQPCTVDKQFHCLGRKLRLWPRDDKEDEGDCCRPALKSRIRVLKPRTKLRLKFVRGLSAARQAGTAKALHTSPSPRDTFCPGFKRS
jgi:hypothetical protein